MKSPSLTWKNKIQELSDLGASDGQADVDIDREIAQLREKAQIFLKKAYAGLTAWQKTQVARHPNRPHLKDLIANLVTDFTMLSGDRAFSDDKALLGGLGTDWRAFRDDHRT